MLGYHKNQLNIIQIKEVSHCIWFVPQVFDYELHRVCKATEQVYIGV